jgi:asparagine synthase (glutamine-hydrolysing)
MCGLTGFVASNNNFPENWRETLCAMAGQIAHRGPDSSGVWSDPGAGVALAHRRLAILDLSPQGHQPMVSASGRFVIVFNGEIYNYRQIMDDLIVLGHGFRGHSDTEVMLAAIEQWGIKDAITRFNGMFAFAIWDNQTSTLFLVRDRLGEKPLFFGVVDSQFVFGSELKALKAHPQWRGEIDTDALAMFMRYGYIPAPYSIYKQINKIRPGEILSVNFSGSAIKTKAEQYWSMTEVIKKANRNLIVASDDEMISGLEQLLLDSIRQQMVADVPLGAFLSGGIDSSTVVALMQSLSTQPIETFTVGFDYDGFDEAEYARKIAQYLGTHHTELYVDSNDALNVIPKLADIYDEPFADSSQIPTYLVSQLTRRHVTVSLSGDGGDELFCGYSRYFLVNNFWMKIAWLPVSLRKRFADYVLGIPIDHLESRFSWLRPLFARYGQAGTAGDKIKKAALVVGAKSNAEFYSLLTSNWIDTLGLLVSENDGEFEHPIFIRNLDFSQDFVSHMMFSDTVRYLPDDILVKVDRAAMANSLESRIPMLDYRIVEYAWRLPLSVKYRNKQGKWILRQVLNKYVPQEMFDRPKKGFSVPMRSWLAGPLRDWTEELLDENRMREQGFFKPSFIREKWQEHLQGKRNWQSQIWSVLVFQSWLASQ